MTLCYFLHLVFPFTFYFINETLYTMWHPRRSDISKGNFVYPRKKSTILHVPIFKKLRNSQLHYVEVSWIKIYPVKKYEQCEVISLMSLHKFWPSRSQFSWNFFKEQQHWISWKYKKCLSHWYWISDGWKQGRTLSPHHAFFICHKECLRTQHYTGVMAWWTCAGDWCCSAWPLYS